MINHQCIQGGDEWLRLRCGKPTASEFDAIITPGGEPTKSEARRSYQMRLLTELILDMPLSTVTTASMQHGKDWEDKARSAYEMMHGVDVELCGFCTNDEQTIGASPDGFVGNEGSIELKCPDNPAIHVGYLSDPVTLVKKYGLQVAGQQYVTGRKWTDLVSYFSGIEMVTVRITPSPEFQAKLDAALKLFVSDFALLVDRAKTKGWIKEPRVRLVQDVSKDLISDEDATAIIEDIKSKKAFS